MALTRTVQVVTNFDIKFQLDKMDVTASGTVLRFRLTSNLPWASKVGHSLRSLNQQIYDEAVKISAQITGLETADFEQAPIETPSPFVVVITLKKVDLQPALQEWKKLQSVEPMLMPVC